MSIELRCDGLQLREHVAHACHFRAKLGSGQGYHKTDASARKAAQAFGWHSHKGRDFCPACKVHLPPPQKRRHRREYVYLSNAQKRALRGLAGAHGLNVWISESWLRAKTATNRATLGMLAQFNLSERRDDESGSILWRLTASGRDCHDKLATGAVDISQYKKT